MQGQDLRAIRARTLAGMQEVMGPLPVGRRADPAPTVLAEFGEPRFLLRKITYAAEPGDRVPAWLFLPRGGGRRPSVVCLHQTTRIGKDEPAGFGLRSELFYARELASLGLVTLAPDYPNFGEYRADPYALGYQSASMKGIWNHMQAVTLLAGLPEVDPARVGVIGHSLGGHNALFLAAFDERVRAVVTSCGFTSFRRYYSGDLTGWSHRGYMPRIAEVYGKDPAKMPFDFPALLASLAPRAVFINAPLEDANFDVGGVRECVALAAGYGPADRIEAHYPPCGHTFPFDIRMRAYAFLERLLA